MYTADNCTPVCPSSTSVQAGAHPLSHAQQSLKTLLQLQFLLVTHSVLGVEIRGKMFCLLPDNKIRAFRLLPIIDYVTKAAGNQYDLSKVVLPHLLVCWVQQPCLAVTHSAGMWVGQTAELWQPLSALKWVGHSPPQVLGWGWLGLCAATIDSLAFKALQSGKPWRKNGLWRLKIG